MNENGEGCLAQLLALVEKVHVGVLNATLAHCDVLYNIFMSSRLGCPYGEGQ